MEFEKAWLSYRRNPQLAMPWKANSVYSNFQGAIARNAWQELQTAAQEILGCSMTETKCREEAGILYGVFHLARMLQCSSKELELPVKKTPDSPLRMLNHWDNMDGSIERGYSGESFFFQKNEVLVNDRTRAYARLAASVGINGVVINNVNAKDRATWLIDEVFQKELKEMSAIFASYGIRLFLSLHFAEPMELGTLENADPCNEEVKTWWKEKMKELYTRLPNLGGFLVKADSEGRPGPFTYGRTHADGANMLAEAVSSWIMLSFR